MKNLSSNIWRTRNEPFQDFADNLYSLVENLLTWSQLQRGRIEHNPQPLDIQKVIARNVTLLNPIAKQKQVKLRSLLEEHIPVYADSNMVDAVVRNLLSNALKFTHSGGNVEISVTQDDEVVEVSVSDTGTEISEKHLSKLFRVDKKYKRLGTAVKNLLRRTAVKFGLKAKLEKARHLRLHC